MPKMTSRETCLFLSIAKAMAYHQPQAVYHQHGNAVLYLITPLGVYQKPFRNDDIQNFVLMICNSYGIDDIQRQAVDFIPLLCICIFFALIYFCFYAILMYTEICYK